MGVAAVVVDRVGSDIDDKPTTTATNATTATTPATTHATRPPPRPDDTAADTGDPITGGGTRADIPTGAATFTAR